MAEAVKPADLPVDLDNEAIILSNAIKSSELYSLFLRKINYLDFRYKEFQTISWAMKELNNQGLDLNIDAIVLKSQFSPVKHVTTFEFINNLVNNYPQVSKTNYENHIQKLQLDKVKSELSSFFFKSIYAACLNPKSDLDFISERMKVCNDILQKGYTYSQVQFKTMAQTVEEYKEYRTSNQGFYTTGFTPLDNWLTEGFKPKGITVFCGLPGMGKTSFVLSSMFNLSHLGVWCPQFALEMDSMSITTKFAAFSTALPVRSIIREFDQLRPEEKKLLDWELQRLSENKYIYLNDTPSQSLSNIREQVMVLQDHLQQEYMFVTIDLFGKIKDLQIAENVAFDYEKKLNEAQRIAKELKINLGLVAQINREATKRKFNRPKMSDLKNAGAWEEVADLILASHRPNYDPEKALKQQIEENSYRFGNSPPPIEEDETIETSDKDLAEIILLKQRMGLGNIIVNFIFDPVTTRYRPIKDEYQGSFSSYTEEQEDGY